MMPASTPTLKNKSSLQSLPQKEADLVRSALNYVQQIPRSLDEEKTVLRLLKIRKALEQSVVRAYDPSKQAKSTRWTGWIISFVTAGVVFGFGLWRVLDRFSHPIQGLDDPLHFLLVFTGLFLISWFPAIIGQIRARKLRKHPYEHQPPDPAAALRAFDLTVVRGLLKSDESQNLKAQQ